MYSSSLVVLNSPTSLSVGFSSHHPKQQSLNDLLIRGRTAVLQPVASDSHWQAQVGWHSTQSVVAHPKRLQKYTFKNGLLSLLMQE